MSNSFRTDNTIQKWNTLFSKFKWYQIIKNIIEACFYLSILMRHIPTINHFFLITKSTSILIFVFLQLKFNKCVAKYSQCFLKPSFFTFFLKFKPEVLFVKVMYLFSMNWMAAKQSWISMFTEPVDFLPTPVLLLSRGGGRQCGGGVWPARLYCTAPLLSKSLLRSTIQYTTQFWRSLGRPGRFSVDSCVQWRGRDYTLPTGFILQFSSTKQDRQQQVECPATADRYPAGWTDCLRGTCVDPVRQRVRADWLVRRPTHFSATLPFFPHILN